MEDIRLYDFEFNLLHIEHDFKSSNWSVYFNDIGTWEGHFDVDGAIVSAAMKQPYLVAVQGRNQAIVTSRQINKELVLYGRTPNWLLTRRTMPRFKTSELSIAKDVESVARYVVGESFPELALGDIVGFSPTGEFWRNTMNSASDVVKDCLDRDGVGHAVIYDRTRKKWVFQVLKGKRLDLIVSEANRNAHETQYDESILDYYSGGWYERELKDMGDWDADTNTPPLYSIAPENYGNYYRVSVAGRIAGVDFAVGEYIVYRKPSGEREKSAYTSVWERVEGDGAKTGIYKWDTALSGTTESEARSELAKKKWETELSAKVRNLKYGTDYNLGDTMRIQKKAGDWMTTFEKQIVGINIWYEHNNMGEQPIFKE